MIKSCVNVFDHFSFIIECFKSNSSLYFINWLVFTRHRCKIFTVLREWHFLIFLCIICIYIYHLVPWFTIAAIVSTTTYCTNVASLIVNASYISEQATRYTSQYEWNLKVFRCIGSTQSSCDSILVAYYIGLSVAIITISIIKTVCFLF